eukprot:gnl/TRDRNA2_/TRDRNA2_39509_c0_seq1.p1 gnl/TRDRNA2_/TRDRNA2_39509_c0~~gnl/TRDRNA2_/TRDRNA2_39509_c0_seq1.p1  ORF type:complete len:202 (+),score=11.95 gnl/TRDRNA2_/TRDRNA2_39509_c0_seq1:68-673(+)
MSLDSWCFFFLVILRDTRAVAGDTLADGQCASHHLDEVALLQTRKAQVVSESMQLFEKSSKKTTEANERHGSSTACNQQEHCVPAPTWTNAPVQAFRMCGIYDANMTGLTFANRMKADIWNKRLYEPVGTVDPVAAVIFNRFHSHSVGNCESNLTNLADALLNMPSTAGHNLTQYEIAYDNFTQLATGLVQHGCQCIQNSR